MVIESYEWFLAHRDASPIDAARSHHQSPVRPGLVRAVEGAAVNRSAGRGTSYTSGSVDPALEVDPAGRRAPPIRPSPSTEFRSTPPPRRPGSRRLAGRADERAALRPRSLAVLAFPLIVALVELRRPHWYPLLDMAQTEIRVRDVATGHPPLIGLAGRIGPFGPNGGSHPGPLSFYALWPVWRLFGGSSYGLFASDVVLDIVAIGSLAVDGAAARRSRVAARDRGRARGADARLRRVPADAARGIRTCRCCGGSCSCSRCGRWSPTTSRCSRSRCSRARSACRRTSRISGSSAGWCSSPAVVLAWNAFRRRRGDRGRASRAVAVGRDQRRRSASCCGSRRSSTSSRTRPATSASSATTSAIRPTRPIGFAPRRRRACSPSSIPWKLLTRTLVHDGGALESHRFVAVPGRAAPARVRGVGDRRVAAPPPLAPARSTPCSIVALALGLVSSARIFGTVWFYLLLWAWGLVALMLFAIGWTVVELVRRRTPSGATTPSCAPIGAGGARAAVTLVVERSCSRSRRRASPCRRPGSTSRSARSSGPRPTALDPAPEQRGSTARTSSPGCPTRRRSVRRASGS